MVSNPQLFEMTRPQIEAAMAAGYDTVVINFGATEQHGLHLPMGTDSIWGEALGLRITQALGDALQLPGIRIGRSDHHLAFAGSLSVSEATFNGIVHDICHNMAHHGFNHIALIPTHGGNFRPIGAAAALVRPTLPNVNIIAYDDLFAFMDVLFGKAAEHGFTPFQTGAHAGENETSLILALRPDLVDLDAAQAGFMGDPIQIAEKIFREGFRAVTETGVLGDPAGASAEFGEGYLNAMTELFTDFIRQARDAWSPTEG